MQSFLGGKIVPLTPKPPQILEGATLDGPGRYIYIYIHICIYTYMHILYI